MLQNKKDYFNVINYFLVARMNLWFRYLIYTKDVKKAYMSTFLANSVLIKCVSKDNDAKIYRK